jgi:hypothetical protein
MINKFRNAWNIAKVCWRVLMLDKELLVFPLLSLVTCGLLVAAALGPVWASGQLPAFLDLLADDPSGAVNPLSIALSFAAYFVAYFVMIFFNSALIACAKIRFAGGDPTVADGLKASVQRLAQIFIWALITSVVGFLLNQAKNGQKGIGRFVLGFLGAGWAIASYFVVPVLVSENISPIAALKRSVSIIKKTWGEALIAEGGMSALVFLAVLPAIALGIAGFELMETSLTASVTMWAICVIWVFTCFLFYSTLDAILKAALYLYATEGKIAINFDNELIENAFSKHRS